MGIGKNRIRKNGIRKKRDSAFKLIGPGPAKAGFGKRDLENGIKKNGIRPSSRSGPAKTGSSLSVLYSCNSRATSACMYAPS